MSNTGARPKSRLASQDDRHTTRGQPKQDLNRMQTRSHHAPLMTEPWKQKLESGKDSEKLMVRNIAGKGRGVVATDHFVKNEYVAEYDGDLLDEEEAKQRWNEYEKKPSVGSFMYYFTHQSKKYCIDGTTSTRLGRLINHGFEGREANIRARVVEVKCRPKLVFFALKDIGPGQEILYEYGDKSSASLKSFPFLVKKPLVRPRLLPKPASVKMGTGQDANSTDGATAHLGNLTLTERELEATIRGRSVTVSLERLPKFVIKAHTMTYSTDFSPASKSARSTTSKQGEMNVGGPSRTHVPNPSQVQSPQTNHLVTLALHGKNVAGPSQTQVPDPENNIFPSASCSTNVAGPSRTKVPDPAIIMSSTSCRTNVAGPSRTLVPDPANIHSDQPSHSGRSFLTPANPTRRLTCPACPRVYGSKGALSRHYKIDHHCRVLPPEITELPPDPRFTVKCDWCDAEVIWLDRHKENSCPMRHKYKH